MLRKASRSPGWVSVPNKRWCLMSQKALGSAVFLNRIVAMVTSRFRSAG